jgi:hypothetical protein
MKPVPPFEVNDDTPVLLIIDSDGYIIRAGHPSCISKKEAYNDIQAGYTMKTVKFSEYKAIDKKWIWDKTPSPLDEDAR